MILKNCIFYLSDLADLPIVKTPNDLHSSVLLETDKHGDILMRIPATSEIDNFLLFSRNSSPSFVNFPCASGLQTKHKKCLIFTENITSIETGKTRPFPGKFSEKTFVSGVLF